MCDKQQQHPACFGKLDIVFPVGEDGLRTTPAYCLGCRHKIQCLRSALAGSGELTVREEFVDRAYASGRIGFLERWSVKKELQRRRKLGGNK